MPAPDFTDQFNTALSPQEEQAFQAWLVKTGRQRDLADYDLRGAWKAGAAADHRGHLPDTFKKPNHPTFSNESIYASGKYPGGEWIDQGGGKWTFQASPWNVQNYGASDLQSYFSKVEPDSKLVLPTAPKAPELPAIMSPSRGYRSLLEQTSKPAKAAAKP